MSEPKYKRLTLTVDPCQGIAGAVSNIVIPGYEFHSLKRSGATAVVTFRRRG